MKPEAEESANRLWWWIAQYGHTKQREFIADLKAVPEDPDEWVIQNRVPVRRGIDRINWMENSVETSCEPFDLSIGKMHGYVNRHGATLHVFCRRRDMPKVEQPSFGQRVEQALTPEWIQEAAENENGCPVGAGASKVEQPEQCIESFDCANGDHSDACPMATCKLGRQIESRPQPQPQKKRVRLWKNSYGSVMSNPDCEHIEGWQELHHDSEGFYTID